MANDFGAGQWQIDAVMATPYPSYVKVANIIWTDQAAAGDQLIIVDRNNKVIIDIKANGANVVQSIGNMGWVNGFKVSTLTSGKVYVYMAGK